MVLAERSAEVARTSDIVAPPALGAWCRPVPNGGVGVCPVCHGCPHPGHITCWSCATVTAQVTHPCLRVVPISLYSIPGELHATLRRYKDARCPDRRRRDAYAVGDLLGRFLERHLGCLCARAGGVDLITTVPSSAGRPGTHPLVGALELAPRVAVPLVETLLSGPAALGHARASDHGFEVSRSVEGAKVVLVDDTLTTGARAQSAASALHSRGAQVLAVVVVGRVVDPSHSRAARRWWREHAGQPFDLDRCCLEATLEPMRPEGASNANERGATSRGSLLRSSPDPPGPAR